jgi:hypothetical protein
MATLSPAVVKASNDARDALLDIVDPPAAPAAPPPAAGGPPPPPAAPPPPGPPPPPGAPQLGLPRLQHDYTEEGLFRECGEALASRIDR